MKKITNMLLTFAISLIMLAGILSPSTTVIAASGDTIVYTTKTGKCYHSDGCSSLSRSKIESTLQNAIDKGLKPCSKCNPPSLNASTSTTKAATKVTTSESATSSSDNTEITFIGNANTKKFHKSTCASAKQIKAENRVEFTCTRDEIISQGYDSCKKCKP